MEAIEQYIVSILPAATAVISAIAVLIKVISALKESKSNTEEQIKKLKSTLEISDAHNIDIKNQCAVVITKLDSIDKYTSETMKQLECKINSIENTNADMKLLVAEYEAKLTAQNQKIEELESMLLQRDLVEKSEA